MADESTVTGGSESSVLVDLEGLTYYTGKQDLKNNNKFLQKSKVGTGLSVDSNGNLNATGQAYTSMTAAEATAGTETGDRVVSPKVLSDFVKEKVSDVVGAAPAALDTLKELGDALGNDANFASTVTTSLANKMDKTQIATASVIGGVKSSTDNGKVAVNSDGTMSVNDNGYVKHTEILADGDSYTPIIGVRKVGLTKGTNPSTTTGAYYSVTDKNGSGIGNVSHYVKSSGDTVAEIRAYNFNGTTERASVELHYDANGDTYVTIPAPELKNNSNKAITGGWFRANGHYDNAGSHNAHYRGKDLTSYFDSGAMSTAIANGTFDDIFIGDYIIKTINLPAITYTDKAGNAQTQNAQTFENVKWLVAGLDVHLHCGYNESADLAYGETKAHHALLIPSYTLQRNVKMNPTNDTEGGYLGSDMWRIHMPNWSAAIKAAFGAGHVLKHYEILSNAVNKTAPSGAGAGWAGSASSWAWTEVEVNIPNEAMVYGGRTVGSFYDVGDFPRQLPLYALKRNHLNDRSWFWLRAVATASNFALADGHGYATAYGASYSYFGGGIRPYFLYK